MMKAILTGASRGLGAALAAALTARGVPTLGASRVVNPALAAHCGPLLRQTPLDLGDAAAVAHWAVDETREDAPARFLADATAAALINNAGVLQPIGPLHLQDPAAVLRSVAVNVAAPLALSAAFARSTAGGPAAGDRRILHISSGAGRTAYGGWSVYCAGKAALDHHARAAALDGEREAGRREAGRREAGALRVASLAPGVIDTDMQAEIRATDEDRFPLRDRFRDMKEAGALTPADVAAERIVAYLLSDSFAAEPVVDLRTL